MKFLNRTKPQPQPICFNIHVGMTDEQLVSALKGNVSGENAQQIVDFFNRPLPGSKLKKEVAKMNELLNTSFGNDFEVLEANGEYALIQKIRYSKSSTTLSTEKEMYLCGLNDDDKYFIHPIVGARDTLKHFRGNLQGLVDWIDKKDQGFDKRIQGDILIQFKPYSEIQDKKIALVDETKIPVHTSNAIVMEFGRHKLMTDGYINRVDAVNDDYYLVHGSKLVIEHPEHKVTKQDIPPGQFAILTNQRGRPSHRKYD